MKCAIELFYDNLLLTRLASFLKERHSPKAFNRVVMFFFGSGLDKANIIGL
jgi:hypothetical protein